MKQTEDILTNYFTDLKTSKVPGQQNLGHLLDKADKGLVKSSLAKSLLIKKWIWIMNSTAILISAGIYMASLSMGDSGNTNETLARNKTEIITSDQMFSAPEPEVTSFGADTTKRTTKNSPEATPTPPVPPQPPAPPEPPSKSLPKPPAPPVAPEPEKTPAPEPPAKPEEPETDQSEDLVDNVNWQASVGTSPGTVYYDEEVSTIGPLKRSRKQDVIRVSRDVVNFSRIKLHSIVDVVYTQSDKASLEIEGEADLVDRIDIKVKNGTLTIDIEGRGRFNPKHVITVYVSSSELTEVESDGTGDVTIRNTLRTDNLKLESNGTGDILVDRLECKLYKVNINGTGNVKISEGDDAKESDIKIAGTGDFDSGDQKTHQVSVQIDGTGSSQVVVMDKLKVKINGTGNVTYSGSPSDVYTNITGPGKVKKK